MGVSLNGGTPQNTPKWSFLVGKPMVVGYHHFRKHPYNWRVSCSECKVWLFDAPFWSLEGNAKCITLDQEKVSPTNRDWCWMLDHGLTSSTRIFQVTSKSPVVLVGDKVYKVGVGLWWLTRLISHQNHQNKLSPETSLTNSAWRAQQKTLRFSQTREVLCGEPGN